MIIRRLDVIMFNSMFNFVTLKVLMHLEFKIGQFLFSRLKLNDFLDNLNELLYYHILIHVFNQCLIVESLELESLFRFNFQLFHYFVSRSLIIDLFIDFMN